METSTVTRSRRGLAMILALGLLASLAALRQASPAGAQPDNENIGIVCTEDVPGTPTFSLTTQTGTILLPDGNNMYMWGYSAGTSAFQHPSPNLCVTEGDTVTVVLHNTLPTNVSIAFPGQVGVLADGVPVSPEFSGPTMTSLTNSVASGGTITYSFTASTPGSFLYESGTDPDIQVNMGLFGALIVRPTLGDTFANNRADSEYTPGEEFMVLFSEIDPYLHAAVAEAVAVAEGGGDFAPNFDPATYKARYWLINGRGFPDTIADNFASWLPNQPYGALAEVDPFDKWTDADAGDPTRPKFDDDTADHPLPGLARYLSVGSENYPMHPHGNNGRVIARDGAPLEAGGDDLSFEKFAINIGPGQTWDVLFQWYDPEGYADAPGQQVYGTGWDQREQNIEYGVFFSGSPYLSSAGGKPTGTPSLNSCGEFYIISHNHALYQITSWGVNMTGPITYMRINSTDPSC